LPHINEVAHDLKSLIYNQEAEYIEARLEASTSCRLSYRGRELETVSESSSAGGNIRVLYRGGWGFSTFNRFENLRTSLERALDSARLAGNRQSQLADVAPVVIKTPPPLHNPREINLSTKKELLDSYNELMWQAAPLNTSFIGYGDGYKTSIFLNSEGSFIEQSRADVSLRMSAIAGKDSDVQQSGISLGSTGNFNDITGLEEQVQDIARKAVAMLEAPRVKGGEYTVILDPVIAGVFTHEAFGHLSEADFVYENERLREIMTLGKAFGSSELNIIDDGTMPNLRGTYCYDEEGTPSQKTYLIREGKLVGRLHSKETAAIMKEKPSGNARAISYRHQPIVRMSNTYIEPGKTTFEEMLSDIKEGIYVKNWYGGTTSMEMFTFSGGEAYMIRNGKVAELIKPVVLSGNVFSTLHNIDAIGNDLDMNQGGGCGKGGQSPLPVSNGSPHIRIRKCLVGGQ
jgi:TldD protein